MITFPADITSVRQPGGFGDVRIPLPIDNVMMSSQVVSRASLARGITDQRMSDRREDFSDLIVAVARQDAAAFGELFDYFAPRVKAMMVRSGLSPQRAEDIAQETLLRVWRKAELFDPLGAGPATWIYTIARNARIDAHRRDSRVSRTENEAFSEPELYPPLADDLIITAEAEAHARACLAELSEEQRAVVRMSFYDGKAHSEIAETLGIPLGTVKSRLRLAMKKLRTLLDFPQ